MQTQAYFENIQSRILEELDKAKVKITIAVAWFTDNDLFNKLCEKSASGVSVELMIFNDEINNNSSNNFSRLESLGGKLYKIGEKDSKTLMHNKFCIIDFFTVINGSYNWSYKAHQNHENITVSTDAGELASQFESEFRRLKERYFGKTEETIAFDVNRVIKRLSLIKTLLDLEETEDIPLQITRLKKFEEEKNLNEIIDDLTNRRYGAAFSKIEDFIKGHSQITIYIDIEINALKLEAKSLEIQLQSLTDEKMEMQKLISNFNVRHTQELGSLIKEILALRKLYAETQEEKQEAEKDEQEYSKEYEVQKNIKIEELSEEEEFSLKKAYREASKLCHPDAVVEKDKNQASALFIELNDAYERNDLEKVKEILRKLKAGTAFTDSSEVLSKKEQLVVYLEELRKKVEALLQELHLIKESEEYQTISNIENWDDYFAEQKGRLKETIKLMKDGEFQ